MANRYEELVAEIPRGSFYDATGHILPRRDSPHEFLFTTGSANTVFGIFVNGEFFGTTSSDASGDALVSLTLKSGRYDISIENDTTGRRLSIFITVRDWATWFASYAEVLEGSIITQRVLPSGSIVVDQSPFVGIDEATDSVLNATRLDTADGRHIQDSQGRILGQSNDVNYINDNYRNALWELRQAYRLWAGKPAGVRQVVGAFTHTLPRIIPKQWRPRWVLGDQYAPNGDLQQRSIVVDPTSFTTFDPLPTLNAMSLTAVHATVLDNVANAPGPFTNPPTAQRVLVNFIAWTGGATNYVTVSGSGPGGGAVSEVFVPGTAPYTATLTGTETFTTITSITPVAGGAGTGSVSVGLANDRFVSLVDFEGPIALASALNLRFTTDADGNDVLIWGGTTTALPNRPVQIPFSGRYTLPGPFELPSFVSLVPGPGGGYDFSDGAGVPQNNRLYLESGGLGVANIDVGVTSLATATVNNVRDDINNALTADLRYGANGAATLTSTGIVTDSLRLFGATADAYSTTNGLKIHRGNADAALALLGLPRSRGTLTVNAAAFATALTFSDAGNGLPANASAEAPFDLRVGRGQHRIETNTGAVTAGATAGHGTFTVSTYELYEHLSAVHSGFLDNASPVTTGITQPTIPARIVLNFTTWLGGDVTVTGTGVDGEPLVEIIPDQPNPAVDEITLSANVFASITSFEFSNNAGTGTCIAGLGLKRDLGGALRISGATNILNNGLHEIVELEARRRMLLRHEAYNYHLVSASPTLTFTTGPDVITRAAGSWLADGFRANREVLVSGTASNDGVVLVSAVTALTMTVTTTLTAEGPVAGTVRGTIGRFVTEGAGTLDTQLWTPGEVVSVVANSGSVLTLASPGLLFARNAFSSGVVEADLLELEDELPFHRPAETAAGSVVVDVDRTYRPSPSITETVTTVGGDAPDGWLVSSSGVANTSAANLEGFFNPQKLVITRDASGPDIRFEAVIPRPLPDLRGFPMRATFWVQQHNTIATQDFILSASYDGATFTTLATVAVAGTVLDASDEFGALNPSRVSSTFTIPYDATTLVLRLSHAGASGERVSVEHVTVMSLHGTGLHTGVNTVLRSDHRNGFGELLYIWSADQLRPPLTGVTAASATGTFAFGVTNNTITRTVGSFVTDGFQPSAQVIVSGTAQNNGVRTLVGVAPLVLTLSPSDTVILETATTATVTTATDTLPENRALGMPVPPFSTPADGDIGHIDTVTNAHGLWERFDVTEYTAGVADNIAAAQNEVSWLAATLTNMELFPGSPGRLSYVRPTRTSRVLGEVLVPDAFGVATLANTTTHNGPFSEVPNGSTQLYRNGVPVPDSPTAAAVQPYVFSAADTIDIDASEFSAADTYTLDYDVLIRAETDVLDLGATFANYMWMVDCLCYRRNDLTLNEREVTNGVQFRGDLIGPLSEPSDQDKTNSTLVRDTGIARTTVPEGAWEYLSSSTIRITASEFDASSTYSLTYTSLTKVFTRVPTLSIEGRSASTAIGVAAATYAPFNIDDPVDNTVQFHQFRITITGIEDTRDVRVGSLGVRGINLFGTPPNAPGIITY